MLIVVGCVPILELVVAAGTLLLDDFIERIAGLSSLRKCLLLQLAISLARLFSIIAVFARGLSHRLALGHHGLCVGLYAHDGLVDFVKVVRLRLCLGQAEAAGGLASTLRSLLLAILVLARIIAIHEGSQWVDLLFLAICLLRLGLRCLRGASTIVFGLAS